MSSSPAILEARLARETLHHVLRDVDRHFVRADVAPLCALVGEAIDRLGSVIGSKPDDPTHLELCSDAIASIRACIESARIAPDTRARRDLEQRLDAVARALEATRAPTIDAVVALQTTAPTPPAEAPPPMASVGLPQLVSLRRAAPVGLGVPEATPTVALGAASAVTRTSILGASADRVAALLRELSDDGDEPLGDALEKALETPPRARFGVERSIPRLLTGDVSVDGMVGRRGFQQRMLRDCAETIGAMARLRHVLPNDVWLAQQADFEQRLLDNLDALVSLADDLDRSDIAAMLVHHVDDGPTTDPARDFAGAFVALCTNDESLHRFALHRLLHSGHPLVEDAFVLASSGGVDGLVDELLGDHDPRSVAAGLRIHARRGEAAGARVELLLEHVEPSVRSAAANAMRHPKQRDRAAEKLDALLSHELDEDVVQAALKSLAVIDSPRARELVRERLREEAGRPGAQLASTVHICCTLLGIVGDARDVGLLTELRAPLGLGLLGFIETIPHLVRMLEELPPPIRPRHAVPPAAAIALGLITGAELSDALADVGRWAPARCPARWRSWWDAHASDFDEDQRYRWGRPLQPRDLLRGLEAHGLTHELRAWLALELEQASGRCLETTTWYDAQRRALASLAEDKTW